MKEIWKDIEGYEGIYQVSNLGRVKGLERLSSQGRKIAGRILVSSVVKRCGHRRVNLSKSNKQTSFLVHILVAKAFIPNPENKPYVLHTVSVTNGGSDAVDNLRWGDEKENLFDIIAEVKTNREKIKELELEVQELKKRLAEAGL